MGIRYITSGNIQDGEIVFEKEVKYLKNFEDYLDAIIDEGDLVISCVNSKAKLGKSGVFKGPPEKCMVGFNNYAIRFIKGINVEYINLFCNSDFFKSQVDKYAKDAINQSSFAGKDLQRFNIPVPPLKEQLRIAQKIALKLDGLTKVLIQAGTISNRIDNVRRSVLGKAFCGLLVKQDPMEGTGHELLEQLKSISTDKTTIQKSNPKKRRAKK